MTECDWPTCDAEATERYRHDGGGSCRCKRHGLPMPDDPLPNDDRYQRLLPAVSALGAIVRLIDERWPDALAANGWTHDGWMRPR